MLQSIVRFITKGKLSFRRDGWSMSPRGLLMCLAMTLAMSATACGTGGAPARGRPQDAASAQISLAAYQLGPGDQLRISVFGEGDLTGQFVVSPQGVVAFPLIGDVPAVGLTVEAFTRRLEERLASGFVRQPKANVEVVNYRPFFILGEVGKPGTYPYASTMTVMNAVATAGGFTYRADTRRVYIKHGSELAEREYRLTSATMVQPGDTVRIAERRF